MTCLHYFFYYFLKRNLPKILGNTLIMPDYWYFWKPSPHFCKKSGVPTMLVVLSPLYYHSFYLSVPSTQIIGIFGNLVPTLVKRVGYPLCWWSYPLFIITPFIYLYHLHRKIAAINQRIKVDNSSINYSRENDIILIQLLALY